MNEESCKLHYYCSICHAIVTIANRQKHVLSHMDTNCSKCSYSSTVEEEMLNHLQSHLDDRFECLQCGDIHVDSLTYQEHFSQHESQFFIRNVSYQCSVCKEHIQSTGNLNDQFETHRTKCFSRKAVTDSVQSIPLITEAKIKPESAVSDHDDTDSMENESDENTVDYDTGTDAHYEQLSQALNSSSKSKPEGSIAQNPEGSVDGERGTTETYSRCKGRRPQKRRATTDARPRGRPCTQGKNVPLLTCDICLKEYHSKRGLEFHRNSKHPESGPLKADIKDGYPKNNEKRENVSTLDDIDKGDEVGNTKPEDNGEPEYLRKRNGWFECPTCQSKFKLKRKLQRHMNDNSCHVCAECGIRFRTPFAHNRHQSVHTGNKDYQCSECGKVFRTEVYLQTHLRIHRGEKRFECKICSAKFIATTSLSRHMRMHSGVRPVLCNICGKRFRHRNHLNEHMRIHNDQKHDCPLCERRITSKSNLIKHLKVHEKRGEKCLNDWRSLMTNRDKSETFTGTDVEYISGNERMIIQFQSANVQGDGSDEVQKYHPERPKADEANIWQLDFGTQGLDIQHCLMSNF